MPARSRARVPLAASVLASWLVLFACTGKEDSDDEGPGTLGSSGGGSTVCDTGGCASGSGSASSGSGGSVGAGGGSAGADPGSSLCTTAEEAASVTLSCPDGLLISDVEFASYGTPTGGCDNPAPGPCHAESSAAVVRALCAGKNSCTFDASNASFGDPCNGTTKSLTARVSCAASVVFGNEPFKGVANSPCDARKALKVSWYYNWMQNESEPCADGSGGVFVPMIWGHEGDEQSAPNITSSVSGFVAKGYDHVLAFNEPDNPTQANVSVGDAMTLLPAFDNPAIRIVSPATAANANPGQAWFSDFMAQLDASSVRVDVLGIHWYGWNAGSCDAAAAQLESYIEWVEGLPGTRPIWLTEWGCLNQSAPDEQTVIDFFQGALAMFARHPRIERYAWYPWSTNLGLNKEDGSLTALGEVYAAAPAYR